MSQCVPSWDLDDNPTHARLDYEVAELTWENGHLAMHALGPPRVPAKPISSATAAAAAKYTWEKPRASGTLESIVNQATRLPHHKLSFDAAAAVDELVPWFDHHRAAASPGAAAISGTMTMDALVPNRTSHVGSCSGPAATTEDEDVTGKRAGVARVAVAPEWSRDQSFSGSATIERESQHVTLDTCDRGFTSTSLGSPENTSHGKPFTKATTTDDHDSVCHSRPQREAGDQEEDKKKGARKSSISNKRSRAAAVHNQSERKRRDKINQRMKTLQKMVPNSSKTDKASMLDEVIEYLKQLQAQVQMMSRMNLAPVMLPMPVQQQLQMSMLAPMGMGMGMGMGVGVVDMNTIGRHNITGISPVLHPTAFMPMSSWDGSGDRLQVAPATVMPDPLSTFLACPSQPMTMDAYSRMAAMYQQLHQHPVLLSTSKG